MAGRYFRRGKSKVHFLPSVAGASPTRPEITAGVDLSDEVAEISGWEFQQNPIQTPDLSTTFTKQIGGEDTAGSAMLRFYDRDDSTGEDLREALAKGTDGYIVFMPYGDVATKRCEVWPVETLGVNDQWSLGNDAAMFQVPFAVTDTPNQDATIPAV